MTHLSMQFADSIQQNGSIILPLSPLGTAAVNGQEDGTALPARTTKRVRLLLDARTELTNAELEARITDRFSSCPMIE